MTAADMDDPWGAHNFDPMRPQPYSPGRMSPSVRALPSHPHTRPHPHPSPHHHPSQGAHGVGCDPPCVLLPRPVLTMSACMMRPFRRLPAPPPTPNQMAYTILARTAAANAAPMLPQAVAMAPVASPHGPYGAPMPARGYTWYY